MGIFDRCRMKHFVLINTVICGIYGPCRTNTCLLNTALARQSQKRRYRNSPYGQIGLHYRRRLSDRSAFRRRKSAAQTGNQGVRGFAGHGAGLPHRDRCFDPCRPRPPDRRINGKRSFRIACDADGRSLGHPPRCRGEPSRGCQRRKTIHRGKKSLPHPSRRRRRADFERPQIHARKQRTLCSRHRWRLRWARTGVGSEARLRFDHP